MSEEQEWCPTMGGTFTGYVPEYKKGDEWKEIATDRGRVGAEGVPYPLIMGDVLAAIDIKGEAQAMALAYHFKAAAEAQGKYVEVRTQEYLINYDIKAKKIEQDD